MQYLLFGLAVISLFLAGCDTPYRVFGHDDLENYVQEQMEREDTICLNDGFDTVCIRTIKGDKGDPGVAGIPVYVLVLQMPEVRDTKPAELVFSDTEKGIGVTREIDGDRLTVSIDAGKRLRRKDITIDPSLNAKITSTDTGAEIVVNVPVSMNAVEIKFEVNA